MPYECRRPDFRVYVEGGSLGPERWLVHGSIAYATEAGRSPRPEVLADARLELMIGISREARRGRDQGASRVLVHVEGDPEIEGLFRATA